jgi:hypothetical protein
VVPLINSRHPRWVNERAVGHAGILPFEGHDQLASRPRPWRFGCSLVVHCGPGMIVALARLSEQPAGAHDLGGRRPDREPHGGLTNNQIP